MHSIADVGYELAGVVGREFLGVIYLLYMICIAGSGMIGVSIALNTLSEHGACTVAFVAVAAIAVFLLSSIQTLDRMSFLGWVGLISVSESQLFGSSPHRPPTLLVLIGLLDAKLKKQPASRRSPR